MVIQVFYESILSVFILHITLKINSRIPVLTFKVAILKLGVKSSAFLPTTNYVK